LRHVPDVEPGPFDRTVGERDRAARRFDQAGDHVENRRLSAAAAADQTHETAGRDIEGHVFEHGDRAAVVAHENLPDVA